MTARELIKLERPECVTEDGRVKICILTSGYGFDVSDEECNSLSCAKCWGREVPKELVLEKHKEGKVTPNMVREAYGLPPIKDEDKIRGLRRKINLVEDDASEIPDEALQEMVRPFAHDDTIEEKFVIATPRILDSGDRTEFESGAVRDMRVGKGRCDLVPLDIAAHFIGHNEETDCVLKCISNFQDTGALKCLYDALDFFCDRIGWDRYTMLLEVAIHFEEGALKYGDDNWRRGIPVNVYIDSGVRHYLKFLRGDTDEPHDRAFCWNILCGIWTAKHMPELNPYHKEEK